MLNAGKIDTNTFSPYCSLTRKRPILGSIHVDELSVMRIRSMPCSHCALTAGKSTSNCPPYVTSGTLTTPKSFTFVVTSFQPYVGGVALTMSLPGTLETRNKRSMTSSLPMRRNTQFGFGMPRRVAIRELRELWVGDRYQLNAASSSFDISSG